MLCIIGLGSSLARGEIKNSDLEAFGLEAPNPSFAANYSCRRSVLDPRKLRMSLSERRGLALQTPTDLGVEALNKAASEAGLSLDSIDLILADSVTPYQTTPAEAQRIGETLERRVNAYDIIGGACASALHLSTLIRWKPERLKSPIALVSTNTPTLFASYEGDDGSWQLGDGAACFIAQDVEKPRGFKVIAASYYVDPSHSSFSTFARYGFYDTAAIPDESYITEIFNSLISEISKTVSLESLYFVLPPFFEKIGMRILEDKMVPLSKIRSKADKFGNSEGAYFGIVLDSMKNEINPGEKILMLEMGSGFSYGFVALEKCHES